MKRRNPILNPNSRQRAALRRENKNWPAALQYWPREDWPPDVNELEEPSVPIVGAWRSRHYFVLGFAERGGMVRLSILSTNFDNRASDFNDKIPWDVLQRLKAEAGYGHRYAVEIYPAECDIVNVANMRHLWLLPIGQVPHFAWQRKQPA